MSSTFIIYLTLTLASLSDAWLQFHPKPADFRLQSRPPLSGGVDDVAFAIQNKEDPSLGASLYYDQTVRLNVSVKLEANTTDSIYVEVVLPYSSKDVPVCLPYGVNNTIICNASKTVYTPLFHLVNDDGLPDAVQVSFTGPVVPQTLWVPVDESESNSSDVVCETEERCFGKSFCQKDCTDLGNATCIPLHCLNLENATCVGLRCLNWTTDRCPVHELCTAVAMTNATCIPTFCDNLINATCVGNACLNWTSDPCDPKAPPAGCSVYDIDAATCIPTHCTNLMGKTCVGSNCLNWTENSCAVHVSCSASKLDNETCIPQYCVNYENATCIGNNCLNWTDDACDPKNERNCSVSYADTIGCLPLHCLNFENQTCVGSGCFNWTTDTCPLADACSPENIQVATCIPTHCHNLVNETCVGNNCLNWTEHRCHVHESCYASNFDNASCIPGHCVNYKDAVCVGQKCLNWTENECVIEKPCPCTQNVTECHRRVERLLSDVFTVNQSADGHALFLAFDRITVNSSTIPAFIEIVSSAEPVSVYIGASYEFKAIAASPWSTDGETSTKYALMKGAELSSRIHAGSSNLNALEAGDHMHFYMEVKHAGNSQEDAASLMVKFVPPSITFVGGNITLGNTTHDLSAANLTGVPFPHLARGDKIYIYFHGIVPDNAPLNGGQLTVRVMYKPINRLDRSYHSQESDTESYSLLRPTVDAAQSTLDIPALWSPGEVARQTITFYVPKGTTRGVDVKTTFSADSNFVKNARWVSSVVTAPSYIIFSVPGTKSVGEAGINRIHSQRRRRATTQNVGFSRTVGDFVNPAATGVSNTKIVITNDYVLDPAANTTSNDTLQLSQSSLTVNGQTTNLVSSPQSAFTGAPDLVITKTRRIYDSDPRPQTVQFMVTVKHSSTSTAPAYDVSITDLIPYHKIFFSEEILPVYGATPNFVYNEVNTAFIWKTEKLDLNDTLVLKYAAVAKNSGTDLPDNTSDYLSQVVYYSADNDAPAPGYQPLKYGPDIVGVCLSKKVETKSSLVLDHGFTALSFFLAAIVAIILVLVIMFLYTRFTDGAMLNQVKPASRADLRNGRNLILDGGESANKKGWNTIKDFETISEEESIVCILSSNDKVQTQRDLDRLDILNTIQVDTDIENERNKAAVATTIGLVGCLRHNQDISPKVETSCVEKVRVEVKAIEKRLEVEFKKLLVEIYKGLSFKNKSKLQALHNKQSKERQELRKKTAGMQTKERTELLKVVSEQQEAEQNELTYLLKLEQDEEAEKLRKEFAMKRRMQLQQVQTEFLSNVVKEGDLSQEQADWLIKEHKKNQSRLEKIYDDEISRQRMILEEKLARRKQLAAANESQEDDESELLNTLAGQQIQTITKMKKQQVLDQDEVKVYMDQVTKDMVDAKNRHDQEKARQVAELHKRLSERKKKALEAKRREQATELEELEKKQKAQQTEQAVDPISLLESRMCIISQHRNELSQLENQIDKEHAGELETLTDELTVKTKDEIEQAGKQLIEKLKGEGADKAMLDKLLQQHNKEAAQLREEHEQNRLSQDEKFKKQLAKRRREWAERREDEKQEQAKLREHDSKVIANLIDNQVAMSETERDRIMEEHEKQMVKLENSLTLNKLQQQRMLGEKLAAKKKQQMEKLQKKQMTETKKQEKSQARNVDDEDEEEQNSATIDLLRKQAEQRLSVLRGESLNYTEELDAIKEEMIKERALSLKDQENRLGAMMAGLQLEKAREMAKIEEQQKAIYDLKANLMEDLNDRGVLSDPQCKKVMDRHQEETEKLTEKLDQQRAKQEKALRKRLEEKLERRENTILQLHHTQLDTVLGTGSNKTAAKLRQMALMHKQKQEIEAFKERIKKQINQNVLELRRQQDVKKKQLLQEKELQFIAGLVRLGHLKQEELTSVLQLLFPGRSSEEIDGILQKIHDGQNDEEDEDENDMLNASSASMLESRVKSARLSRVHSSASLAVAGTPPKRRKKRRLSLLKPKGYKRTEDALDEDEPMAALHYQSIHERPDPIGGHSGDDVSPEGGRRKLPPLKSKGKKKKKPKSDD